MITGQKEERLEEIFAAALEQPPEARAAFVRKVCGAETDLEASVRDLLDAHERAEILLERPVTDHFPELTAGTAADAWTGKRIGPFVLERVMATGGMGTVYEAVQDHTRRRAALKITTSGLLSETALRRFRYEAEILGRLRHPGIAHIYEAGVHEEGALDLPYIAMELIEGARAVTDFAREERLSRMECLRLFARICDAVHYAHVKGVIHRDLKPGNVLIDADGNPKVIDFGVARIERADFSLSSTLTRAGQVVGTLPYMSPEQCGEDPSDIDIRTDVYSLGVLGYELLTGELPHPVEDLSVTAAIARIRDGRTRRPSSIVPDLRGDLETILLKALEPDRERRYGSALALGADVEHLLRHEPIAARPPSTLYQLRKFVARHKAPSAFLIVLVVSLAVFGIAMALMAREARQEAEVAEQVTTFMEELFSRASPAHSLGEDVPLRLVLDQGALLIDRELQDQPAVRARLLYVLGHSYHSLGSYERAEGLYREVARHAQAQYGPENYWTLHLQVDIANALEGQGEYAEAERLLRETLGTLEGADKATRERLWANGQQRLGYVLKELGRLEEAELALRTAVDLERARTPHREPDLADSVNVLAGFLHETERHAEALPLFEEALAIYASYRPEGDPRIPVYRQNLARCLVALDDYERALEENRLALEDAERILSPEHPYYASMLVGFGYLLLHQGRYAEAEPELRRALEIQERELDADHPRIGLTCNDLGQALHRLGEYDQAEAHLRRAVAIYQRTYPGDHRHLAIATVNLADVLASQGKLPEAERVGREGLAMHRRLDPEGPGVGIALGVLSWTLILQGRLDPAEEAASESIAVLQRWPAQGLDLGVAHTRLAFIHNQRGAAALAEEQCLKALENIRRAIPGDHVFLGYAHYHLGWARLQQGDREGAESAMGESVAMFRRLFPAGHPDAAWPLNHLGEVVVDERVDEAIELFEDALELRRRHGADPHWLCVSLVNLGNAYQRSGRDDLAGPLVEEAIRIRSQSFAHDQRLASCLNTAAEIQARLGNYREAADHAAACLELQRRLLPPGDAVPLRTASFLGELRARLGQHEEAELLLLDTYEALLLLSGESGSVRETLERLVLLYELWERPDEAESFRAEMAALEER